MAPKFERFVNNAQTTLASSIDASVNSITVDSASLFPTEPNFTIIIENEIMAVTSVVGATWGVIRGAEGTTAAPHTGGVQVAQVLTRASMFRVSQNPTVQDGRLSYTASNPAPVTAEGSTLFLVPYDGGRISLYNTTDNFWYSYPLESDSSAYPRVAVPASSGTMFDIFANWVDASSSIHLTTEDWLSGNTGRNKAISKLDGVWVMSEDNSKRYLGTAITVQSSYGVDTPARRLLYNQSSKVVRPVYATIPPTGIIADRVANANTWEPLFHQKVSLEDRMKFQCVVGVPNECKVELKANFLGNLNTNDRDDIGALFGFAIGEGLNYLISIGSTFTSIEPLPNTPVCESILPNGTSSAINMGPGWTEWVVDIPSSGTKTYFPIRKEVRPVGTGPGANLDVSTDRGQTPSNTRWPQQGARSAIFGTYFG